MVVSKDCTRTKNSKTPDSKTNSSRLTFLEQSVRAGCCYQTAWMVSLQPWGQEAVISPAGSDFPVSTASPSTMANISSELLISGKRPLGFHRRKPFLFRQGPSGRTRPGWTIRQRLWPPSLQLGPAHCLKAFANNGSIICRTVTKQGLLGQRIIKPLALFLFPS